MDSITISVKELLQMAQLLTDDKAETVTISLLEADLSIEDDPIPASISFETVDEYGIHILYDSIEAVSE